METIVENLQISHQKHLPTEFPLIYKCSKCDICTILLICLSSFTWNYLIFSQVYLYNNWS